MFGGAYLNTVYERTGQKTGDDWTEKDRDRTGHSKGPRREGKGQDSAGQDRAVKDGLETKVK
jgi:hypothetical protein